MASKESIAIRESASIDRITSALNRMLENEGVDPVKLPRLGRYPELLHNQQLEAIATALEVLSPAPYVEPEPEAMTLPAEDMPPEFDDPEITDFDISPDGVIVAETDDGEAVVSDGQEQPEEDDDPEPRKGKGRR